VRRRIRASRPARRRSSGELGRIAQARDARPVLTPFRQSLLPALRRAGCELLGRLVLDARLVPVDPGEEIRRLQIREGQQQVGEVALGIDHDGRNAIERSFFQQREAQTGLAAAGHADAQGVRHEILGLVQSQPRLRLVAGKIEGAAEVEDAELLEVGGLHAKRL
jgi:hypothetical protein